MPVDSPLFLLVWLPVVLGVFAFCPGGLRGGLLLAASLLFYALSDVTSLPLLCLSAAGNMLLGLAIGKAEPGSGARRALLAAGVGANLLLLAWAKYFSFLTAQVLGISAPAWMAPAGMPLGVSFFTFSAVAYLMDVSRGQQAPEANPLRFGLFMVFFPKITAGPIARYRDMFPEGGWPAAPTMEDLRAGLARLAVGLAKKALVAGTLGPMADAAFGEPAGRLDMGTAWLGLASYSLQLYFDFSGYTDMAVGLGRMFGYKLPENFNYPYVSQSVREFWRRWHMTLSSWFRDYLYIPLGGGRVAPWKVQRNLLAVFALCGLWHGASWSFVVWGLWHGVFLALERTRIGKALDALPRPLRHAYALAVVCLGWVFFRAADFSQALAYFSALAGANQSGFDYTWMVRVNRQYMAALAVGLIGSAPALPWLAARLEALSPAVAGACARLAAPVLLAAALLQLAAGTYAPFIYAQF
ncbi:MBOAT family O-acyltransferase [Fundidesulfovibrio soli]|uniref:MBOAT family O-acyltransferase n=1 Tax=Fundidesulfovibrio soli TaxID=2922716 RepID=UPI001FAEE3D6|nr:MBOAT family O-acyltransferase [Fundidesulfovibrio soli]